MNSDAITPSLPRRAALASGLSLALWLAGCGSPAPTPGGPAGGTAATREYRRAAASHIYSRYQNRIYRGQLPPLLYAVGTLQVHVDSSGRVQSTNWLRAPKHAPEVISEIERLVRSAAPYPAPPGAQRIVWTDTWLWDKSGQFQLDTLSEGQL